MYADTHCIMAPTEILPEFYDNFHSVLVVF